jgi:hypothetical protein
MVSLLVATSVALRVVKLAVVTVGSWVAWWVVMKVYLMAVLKVDWMVVMSVE